MAALRLEIRRPLQSGRQFRVREQCNLRLHVFDSPVKRDLAFQLLNPAQQSIPLVSQLQNCQRLAFRAHAGFKVVDVLANLVGQRVCLFDSRGCRGCRCQIRCETQ
jgi:hypothetical protein